MSQMRAYVRRLAQGQSMRNARLEEARDRDAHATHREIRKNPGIAKREIAKRLRFSPARVKAMIDWINAPDSPFVPVRYDLLPVNGEMLRGWFTVDRRSRHVSLRRGDEHLERVEYGVRFRRLADLLKAEGVPGAEAVIRGMEERLDVTVEKLSETDLDAFIELVLDENGASGAAA